MISDKLDIFKADLLNIIKEKKIKSWGFKFCKNFKRQLWFKIKKKY